MVLTACSTRGKWGLKEYKWRGPSLGWFVGLVVSSTRDFCSALAALVGPLQNIFFPLRILCQFLCPQSPSKLGRQSCWVALSLSTVWVSGGQRQDQWKRDRGWTVERMEMKSKTCLGKSKGLEQGSGWKRNVQWLERKEGEKKSKSLPKGFQYWNGGGGEGGWKKK